MLLWASQNSLRARLGPTAPRKHAGAMPLQLKEWHSWILKMYRLSYFVSVTPLKRKKKKRVYRGKCSTKKDWDGKIKLTTGHSLAEMEKYGIGTCNGPTGFWQLRWWYNLRGVNKTVLPEKSDTRRRQRHRQARIHESQERCFNKAYQWLQNILTYMHARPNDDCVLHRINTTEKAEPNSHALLAVLNYSTSTFVNRKQCYTLIHKKYCQTPVPIPQMNLRLTWNGLDLLSEWRNTTINTHFTQTYARSNDDCVLHEIFMTESFEPN